MSDMKINITIEPKHYGSCVKVGFENMEIQNPVSLAEKLSDACQQALKDYHIDLIQE